MSIRNPVKADIDIRNAFDDVAQEIANLKRELERVRGAAPQLPTAPTPTTNLELATVNPADMSSGNSGPGTVLTSDGAGNPSWAPALGGLVTVGEAGEGGRSLAQQVLGVNGSLSVLNGLSADSVRCRQLRPQITGVKVRRVSDVTFAQAAFYNVVWTAKDFDTDNFHSLTTNPSRITIPAGLGGVYLVGFTFNLAVTGNATYAQGFVQPNGSVSPMIQVRDTRAAATTSFVLSSASVLFLDGGSYYELAANVDGSGTATVDYTSGYESSPQFFAVRLGGVGG